MEPINDIASVATLIGDVVGSRGFRDRHDLHVRLTGRIEELNDIIRAWGGDGDAPVAVAPLRVTVGDEYQGSFRTLGAALFATRWLRLALLPDVDVRHGLGWGPVEVLTEQPRVEDGPGWWAARDAVDAVARDAGRAGQRRWRTAYRRAEGSAGPVRGPDPGAVNAALVLRDELVGGLSDRSMSVLRGLLSGRTQREIAAKEGVSASAVSQRVRHDGLAALVASEGLLAQVR